MVESHSLQIQKIFLVIIIRFDIIDSLSYAKVKVMFEGAVSTSPSSTTSQKLAAPIPNRLKHPDIALLKIGREKIAPCEEKKAAHSPVKAEAIAKDAVAIYHGIVAHKALKMEVHANEIKNLTDTEQLKLLDLLIRFHLALTLTNLPLFDKLGKETLAAEKVVFLNKILGFSNDECLMNLLAAFNLSVESFGKFVLKWAETRSSDIFFGYFFFLKARMTTDTFHALLCKITPKHPFKMFESLLNSGCNDALYIEKITLTKILKRCFYHNPDVKNDFKDFKMHIKMRMDSGGRITERHVDNEDGPLKKKLYYKMVNIWNRAQERLEHCRSHLSQETRAAERQWQKQISDTFLEYLQKFSSCDQADINLRNIT